MHMFKKILFIVGLLNCGDVFAMEEKADEPAAISGAVCVDESLISEDDKGYIAGLLTMASSALLTDFSDLEKAYPYFTNHEARTFKEVYERIESSPCSYRSQEEIVKVNLDRLYLDADVQRVIRDALQRNRK